MCKLRVGAWYSWRGGVSGAGRGLGLFHAGGHDHHDTDPTQSRQASSKSRSAGTRHRGLSTQTVSSNSLELKALHLPHIEQPAFEHEARIKFSYYQGIKVCFYLENSLITFQNFKSHIRNNILFSAKKILLLYVDYLHYYKILQKQPYYTDNKNCVLSSEDFNLVRASTSLIADSRP